MALEAGIAALQLLYKLAKMIKETRENIILVRDKLDDTETIAKLIDMKIEQVDKEACPPEILQGIRTRFAQAKRVARKLRLKYDPLLPLVTSLGGNATLVKAQAAMMRKGVLGASMALGSLSVILWRYVHRTDQRVRNNVLEALAASGVPVEKYTKMTLTDMVEALKDQQAGGLLALLSNPMDFLGNANALIHGDLFHGMDAAIMSASNDMRTRVHKTIKDTVEGIVEEGEEVRTRVHKKIKDAVEGIVEKGEGMMEEGQERVQKTIKDTVEGIVEKGEGMMDEGQEMRSRVQKTIKGTVEGVVKEGEKVRSRVHKAKKTVEGIVEEGDDIIDEETEEEYSDTFSEVSEESSKIGLLKQMSQQDFFARAESQRAMLQAHLKVDSATLDNVLKRAASKISMASTAVNSMKGLVNDSAKHFSTAEEKLAEVQQQSTTLAQSAVKSVKGMFSKVTSALTTQSLALSKGIVNTAMETVESAVGNSHLLDGIQSALHLGENGEEKTHFQMLQEHGYFLETYAIQHQANEALRGMLEMIDHLNQELKVLNNDAKTYDNDDGEIDAGDDLIPQVEKKHNSKDRKHFVHEGVEMLMELWFEKKSLLTKADIKRVMGKGYNKSNLNLLWRYLRRQDTADKEGSQEVFADATEETIRPETMCTFLQSSSSRNLGLALCAIEICILNLMNKANMPEVIADSMDIVTTMLNPLIGYTASFGLLVALEEIRDHVKDDPQEIAILEAEMDEEALERRLGLVKAFATDFKESIEHGFAPDPSLMLSIAVEVSTSFVGLGPTTKRRLQILQSIVGLTSIEADVKKIEKVDTDLKAEVAMMQSLPTLPDDHNAEHFGRIRADQEALGQTTKSIVMMLETLKENFDVRTVLGDRGEASEFWVNSFGKECYEVHWHRFLAALKTNYSNIPDKHLSKIRLMLVDVRGDVTALQLQQFVSFNGSLAKVITKLAKRRQLPKTLQEIQDKSNNSEEKGADAGVQLPELHRGLSSASATSVKSWEDRSVAHPSASSPSTAPSPKKHSTQASTSPSNKLPQMRPALLKQWSTDSNTSTENMRSLFARADTIMSVKSTDSFAEAKSVKSMLSISRQASTDSLYSYAASAKKEYLPYSPSTKSSDFKSGWNNDSKVSDFVSAISEKSSKKVYYVPPGGSRLPAAMTPTEKRQARVRLYNV